MRRTLGPVAGPYPSQVHIQAKPHHQTAKDTNQTSLPWVLATDRDGIANPKFRGFRSLGVIDRRRRALTNLFLLAFLLHGR
jgi:hypothetical protein